MNAKTISERFVGMKLYEIGLAIETSHSALDNGAAMLKATQVTGRSV